MGLDAVVQWVLSRCRSPQFVAAIAALIVSATSASTASAHLGRRLRIDVVDGQIVAVGANTGQPDGLPDVRPYAGVVHDHWKNYTVPALPVPMFAQTYLPEFDVPASVTELVGYSLHLELKGAWQWAHPMMPHHGHATPHLTPLDPGEVIRIDGAQNTWTDSTQMGSLLLSPPLPAGGDPDISILYSINGHPHHEIHVLKFVLSAEPPSGGPAFAPSDPLYVLLSPDGATMAEKLHHESLFLEEYLANVPEPSSAGLLLLGFALSCHARRHRS
jgi:hypothetical protein